MSHHGNTCRHNPCDCFADGLATFELDGIAMRFFENTPRIAHGLFDRDLIAHKRQINHDHRIFHAAHNGCTVGDHVINRNGKRIRIAQHDIAEAVAHENRIDRTFFNQTRRGVVVAREH